MLNNLVILDNFYDNPDHVREAALKADYQDTAGQRFPGQNSVHKYPPPGLDRMVSHLFGEPVVGDSDPRSTHGKFRITREDDGSRYMVHADPSHLRVVGVCYLTRPEHCRGGTLFYRHKALDSDRTPLKMEELEALGYSDMNAFFEGEGNARERWEHIMTVPMRYNRLILYRPWLWHSAGESFGDRPENCRLIQVVGFRTGQPA